MEYNKERILEFQGHKYYLDEWEIDEIHPCSKCELSDLCDKMADDLNKNYYGLCENIPDSEYAFKNQFAYFKKIE